MERDDLLSTADEDGSAGEPVETAPPASVVTTPDSAPQVARAASPSGAAPGRTTSAPSSQGRLPARRIVGLAVLGLAVAVIAVAGIAQTTRVAGETAHAVAAAAKSPTTLAKIGAQAARQKFDLPYTVDDNTTLEAIEADGPAVRYSYSVHGLDPALLTADALKAVAVPRLCTTPATRNLLEKHVAVDYVWHIEESGDDLVFEITDADC